MHDLAGRLANRVRLTTDTRKLYLSSTEDAFGTEIDYARLAKIYDSLQTIEYNAEVPNNVGLVLAQKGQVDDAILHYQKALSINPTFVEAHNNLGMALAQKGQLDEAIHQYHEVLRLAPAQAETHNNLAIVLAQKGQMIEAIAEFQEAVRLKPDYATAQNNLAKAQASLNQSHSRQ